MGQGQAQGQAPANRWRRRIIWLMGVILVLAVIITGDLWVRQHLASQPQPEDAADQIAPPDQVEALTEANLLDKIFAVGPDGRSPFSEQLKKAVEDDTGLKAVLTGPPGPAGPPGARGSTGKDGRTQSVSVEEVEARLKVDESFRSWLESEISRQLQGRTVAAGHEPIDLSKDVLESAHGSPELALLIQRIAQLEQELVGLRQAGLTRTTKIEVAPIRATVQKRVVSERGGEK